MASGLTVAGGVLAAAVLFAASPVVTGTLPTAMGVDAADTAELTWSWPLQPRPRVLTRFDAPPVYGAGSRGVDLAAAVGQPVLAAAAGTVGFAGLVAGTPVVTVDHGGVVTTYLPVAAAVTAGQVIGRGGRLGTVTALPRLCGVQTCLHWGAYTSRSVPRTYLDPLALLGAGPVRLLPVNPLPAGPGAPAVPETPAAGPYPTTSGTATSSTATSSTATSRTATSRTATSGGAAVGGAAVATVSATAPDRARRIAVTAAVATIVSAAGLLAPLVLGGTGTAGRSRRQRR